MRVDFTILKD